MRNREYSKFEILQVVDIKTLLSVGWTKAHEYHKDIKEEYKVSRVLYCHFLDYFKVPDVS